MSTQRNDGGPAFPLNPDTNVSHKGDIYEDVMGLSKLDWFAGQALPQAVEDYDRKTRHVMDTKDHVLPWATKDRSREQIIAWQAYRYARAMLAESLAASEEGAAA